MALAAFAALVPKNVLELTPGGILNVHPSLLPRWRGAAPIQSALLAGDEATGVSIIRLVKELDAGPILLQERMPIAPEDDYVSLEPRLASLGARLLVQALEQRPTPQPQDDSAATFSRRIERDDARIDWSQPNTTIWNQVRAYRGWPQAFTTFNGQILKVLKAWPLGAGAPRVTSEGSASTQDASRTTWLEMEGASARPGTVWVRTPEAEDDLRPFDRGPLVGIGLDARKNGRPVVAAGSGWLRLDEVQLEGRRAQTGEEFLRGYPRLVGSVLGDSVA
jgi:methionyl-tRNA formyltransferase